MIDIIADLILYGLLIFMIVYFTDSTYSAIFLAIAAIITIVFFRKLFGKKNDEK